MTKPATVLNYDLTTAGNKQAPAFEGWNAGSVKPGATGHWLLTQNARGTIDASGWLFVDVRVRVANLVGNAETRTHVIAGTVRMPIMRLKHMVLKPVVFRDPHEEQHDGNNHDRAAIINAGADGAVVDADQLLEVLMNGPIGRDQDDDPDADVEIAAFRTVPTSMLAGVARYETDERLREKASEGDWRSAHTISWMDALHYAIANLASEYEARPRRRGPKPVVTVRPDPAVFCDTFRDSLETIKASRAITNFDFMLGLGRSGMASQQKA